MQGCKGVGVQGCKGVGVQGCKGVGLQGSLETFWLRIEPFLGDVLPGISRISVWKEQEVALIHLLGSIPVSAGPNGRVVVLFSQDRLRGFLH